MRELSVFVDESGDLGSESKYYLLALVFHDQSDDLSRTIGLYERDLAVRGLENLTFHLNPLLRGNERYASMTRERRSAYLASFSTFAQHSPFTYRVFSYRKDRFRDTEALGARMRRDLVKCLFDNIEWFQAFDLVKIYYDDGQQLVTRALHDGFEYALAREAVMYRDARPADYRMLQIADYVCGVELAALKYDAGEEGGHGPHLLRLAPRLREDVPEEAAQARAVMGVHGGRRGTGGVTRRGFLGRPSRPVVSPRLRRGRP